MGVKDVVLRRTSEPESDGPTGGAENVASNLAADMKTKPLFPFEWEFPEVPCKNDPTRQERSPPHNVQNSMHLN